MISGSGRATSSRAGPALAAGRQLAAIKYQSQDSQPQGARTPAVADQAEGALQSAPHTAAGILEGQRRDPAAFRHCVNPQSLSDVHGNLCRTPKHPACQVACACLRGLGKRRVLILATERAGHAGRSTLTQRHRRRAAVHLSADKRRSVRSPVRAGLRVSWSCRGIYPVSRE